MRRATLPLLCIVIAVSGLLGGCSRSMSDLEAYVAEVKSRKSRQIEPIPQIKQFESFTYVPGTRPDPFQRLEPETDRGFAADTTLRPNITRNKEPLEEFPLDGLRMMGTILYNGRVYALIRAPDGILHRVTRGTHMGQNYGEIVAIDESQVQLSEIVPDGFGGWVQRPAVLALTVP